jgi:hypothetical protein
VVPLVVAALLSGAGLVAPQLAPNPARQWWAALYGGPSGAPSADPADPPASDPRPASRGAGRPGEGPSTRPLESANAGGGGAAPDPAAVQRLPGGGPKRGSGTYSYAAGRGPVLGRSGLVRRFRVAVERGSDEDVGAFAAEVEAILGDRRSWIGGGLRLQRVAGAEAHDFTVYLATVDTAEKLCRAGGVWIVGPPGRVSTSCRVGGKVVINLQRWRGSAPPYLKAGRTLASYRQYLVNHEVGHELGHGHQGCPRAGAPAPVMVQQTLTLRGCTPFSWPRRSGANYVGPSVG